MSLHQDGTAGSLIDTTGLHANDTVLYDIYDTDTVLAAQLVQGTDDIGDLHLLTVNGSGNTLFKGHGHIFTLIGSLLGSHTKYQQMLVVRLVAGIFQFQTFVADVPDITVTAVGRIGGERKMNAMSLAVFDLGFPGVHVPFVASPGSDDLDIGSQSLDAQLETDLVVTFTGCTVADGYSAFFSGNLYQFLGDQGSCHGST